MQPLLAARTLASAFAIPLLTTVSAPFQVFLFTQSTRKLKVCGQTLENLIAREFKEWWVYLVVVSVAVTFSCLGQGDDPVRYALFRQSGPVFGPAMPPSMLSSAQAEQQGSVGAAAAVTSALAKARLVYAQAKGSVTGSGDNT